MAVIFLDLDGTLTDSRPGIINSILSALDEIGLEKPDPATLDWAIGPPLLDSFRRLGAPDPDAALAAYRTRYTTVGLFENEVYRGIPELLTALRDAGHLLCVATAKPHAYATRITAHFGLAAFMTHEFGPGLDGTHNDKADLLAHALRVTGADPAQSVMIGDRYHDYDAAKANGLASIAVTWGYGTVDEFARADMTVNLPEDIPAAIDALLSR